MQVSDADLFVIVPLAALGFWWMLMFFISRISGWSTLAETYATDQNDLDGERLRMQSLTMTRGLGTSSYGAVVNVGADAASLRLSVVVVFRPFHPPLRIPFADLVATPKRVFLLDGVELVAARAPMVKIVVNRQLAAWVAERAGGALRLPAAAA